MHTEFRVLIYTAPKSEDTCFWTRYSRQLPTPYLISPDVMRVRDGLKLRHLSAICSNISLSNHHLYVSMWTCLFPNGCRRHLGVWIWRIAAFEDVMNGYFGLLTKLRLVIVHRSGNTFYKNSKTRALPYKPIKFYLK